MKLSKNYQYQILCEDAQSRSFINAVLTDLGINSHRIYFINYPCGEGCGEAFVRREFPVEVKRLHAVNYMNRVLIVCTDADKYTVEERIRILAKEMQENKSWDRSHEPIILWIPKREIETWIHFLRGESVDEEMTFTHSGKPVSCKGEARLFSRYCQDLEHLDCSNIGSLIEAKREYERVCQLQRN